MPNRAAIRMSEWQTLLPSPTYAMRRPASVPNRSRSVIASASAWSGCVSSVSPLMTGIDACSANSSTSCCSNVLIMSAERNRESTRAVSRNDSPRASWSSAAGRKSAIPPSSAIPTSNATRVRVDGLWKIRPIVRPGRTRSSGRRALSAFSSSARSRSVASSSLDQPAMRVKLLPFSSTGTPAIRECYGWR